MQINGWGFSCSNSALGNVFYNKFSSSSQEQAAKEFTKLTLEEHNWEKWDKDHDGIRRFWGQS